MIIEIISWSISTKVWYPAGIGLVTPGSAFRLASVARYVTNCATWPVKKQYGPCFYSVWSGSRLFAYTRYQLTNWQIRLFWPEYNMEYDLCFQQRPKAEEISWFKVTFYNYDLSSMLATKIHDLSSKTSTSKLTCWQRQPFFLYLSSLMVSNNFIKSNCGFKFGRNVAEW